MEILLYCYIKQIASFDSFDELQIPQLLMNASKHKKNTDFLEKISTFDFQKNMPFKLFEILRKLMIGAFLIT